jgi:Fe2+ transport system protein B
MSSIKIALAGNPNCGKTTLFNDLTGSSQYVGNWPGVTVEKKEGFLRVIVRQLFRIFQVSTLFHHIHLKKSLQETIFSMISRM